MRRGRILIAGLAATAAMMAADASAQNCPEWTTLSCPSESLAVPAEEAQPGHGDQATRGKPTSASAGARTKQGKPAAPAAPAATDAAATAKPQQAQQAQTTAQARPIRTARPAMNAKEKEALFQQFMTWREERRQNPEPNR